MIESCCLFVYTFSSILLGVNNNIIYDWIYVHEKRKKSYRRVKIRMGIIIGMSVWFQWFYVVGEHIITYMLYDKIRYIVEDTSLTF